MIVSICLPQANLLTFLTVYYNLLSIIKIIITIPFLLLRTYTNTNTSTIAPIAPIATNLTYRNAKAQRR